MTSGSAAPARTFVTGTLAPKSNAARSPKAIPRVTSPVYFRSSRVVIASAPIPRPAGAVFSIHLSRGRGTALKLLDLLARLVELRSKLLDLCIALAQPRLGFGELEEETADLHHQPGSLGWLGLGRARWRRRGVWRQRRLRG